MPGFENVLRRSAQIAKHRPFHALGLAIRGNALAKRPFNVIQKQTAEFSTKTPGKNGDKNTIKTITNSILTTRAVCHEVFGISQLRLLKENTECITKYIIPKSKEKIKYES